MASFPSNPVVDQQHIENGITYIYTGEKWKAATTSSSYRGVIYTAANNAVNIDLSLGNIFELQYSSNTTISFVNPPAADSTQTFRVMIDAPATTGFALNAASYDNVTSAMLTASNTPYGSTFSYDGTKFYYILGTVVYQHNLTEAWNPSTASTTSTNVSAAQDTQPYGITFKPDGTMMYVTGTTNDFVYRYTLSRAWDITSATYVVSGSVASQQTLPFGVRFKPDGATMYISGAFPAGIHQYSFSSPWLSGLSYTNKFLSTSGQSTSPTSFEFNSTGSRIFVLGNDTDTVYRYNLSTPWDISTGSYSGISFSVTSQEATPHGIYFKPDGDKMYIFGSTGKAIKQYSTVFQQNILTWPVSVMWAGVGAPVITPGKKHVFEFFTSDGGASYMAYPIERDVI